MPAMPPAQDPARDADFVSTLRRRVHENPKDMDALTALGSWLLQRGQADKALECFHRVTKQDPAYPGIWRLKARAFDALGDSKSAEMCRKRGADVHS